MPSCVLGCLSFQWSCTRSGPSDSIESSEEPSCAQSVFEAPDACHDVKCDLKESKNHSLPAYQNKQDKDGPYVYNGFLSLISYAYYIQIFEALLVIR